MVTKERWEELIGCATDMVMKMTKDGTEELEMVICHLLANEDPKDGTKINPPAMLTYLSKFVGDSDEKVSEQKQSFSKLLRFCSAASRAEGSIFITEAWMAPFKENSEQSRPEFDPERVEALVIVTNHREHGRYYKIAMIGLAPDGKRTCSPWTTLDDANHAGLFSDLVCPHEISDFEVEIARGVIARIGDTNIQMMDIDDPAIADHLS